MKEFLQFIKEGWNWLLGSKTSFLKKIDDSDKDTFYRCHTCFSIYDGPMARFINMECGICKQKRISIKFVWEDFWIGFYWDKEKYWLYTCIIPMLPIIIRFRK